MKMGMEDARHLLGRAEFGGSPARLAEVAAMSRPQAIKALLTGVRTTSKVPAPAWAMEGRPGEAQREEMSRREIKEMRQDRAQELKGWWYRELLATDSPLTERMVLFWHNHFTSGLRKVKWPPFLHRQNALLRRHALGSFEALLRAIPRDPAMLLYLDNQTSHRREPNENFARELLELFTLGEGHYTEDDIKEAARAFTGWRMRPRTGEFRFVKADHDAGEKNFLGKRGRFDGDDILDLLLAHPRTAERIVEKLWREFVSDTPQAGAVKALAASFRQGGYQIAPLMAELLGASAFWAPTHRGALIKSPVDLMVGTVRTFGIPLANPAPLLRAGRALGQDLFEPPNVKGWPGGTRWISTQTLLVRHRVLGQAIQRGLRGLDAGAWAMGRPFHEVAVETLLALPPVHDVPEGRPRDVVAAVLLDPVYQLK